MTKINAGMHADVRELAAEELNAVAGGLFLPQAAGFILPYYAAINRWVSPLDKVALNPQPLPPRQLAR